MGLAGDDTEMLRSSSALSDCIYYNLTSKCDDCCSTRIPTCLSNQYLNLNVFSYCQNGLLIMMQIMAETIGFECSA